MSSDEVTTLEEQGWRALASGPAAALEFYERVLDDAVLMLLPGGLALDDRDTILKSMSGQPWASFELSDWRVVRPTPDTAVVAYRADAQRDGSAPYSALISSVYVRRQDGWKLTVHQQTPC
ncbi:nuclear transport factor 2 family protein [Cryptosporangium minutisporangium]|uniref:DUF4440 domain-containing protein n=1 Tax=Cryptosporangium minutisporangium TaxID=113569 RepID=A0ABP6SSY4_9ACTN